MIFRSFALLTFALTLSACNINGSSQKGPFVAGSQVTLSKLDNQNNPIPSNTATASIEGKEGRYSSNEIEWSGWTLATVTGQYFNELTNSVSLDSLTLDAIMLKDKKFDTANINLFTHLASARIKQHRLNDKSQHEAWQTTQDEMKHTFNLKQVSNNIHRGVEQLSLTKGSGQFRKDNANLLLFTGGFLSTNGGAETLEALTNDFADDAIFNGIGLDLFNQIANAASAENFLTTLSQNLSNYGVSNPPNNGDMPELPNWVNNVIDVEDNVAPIITIGLETVSLTVGDTFIDDVMALDNRDGDVSSNISFGGDFVDTNTAGNYQRIYDVSDQAGNPALQIVRLIIVSLAADTVAPEISLNTVEGNVDLTVEVNTEYTDPGATANDDRDGEISVTIDSTMVDTSVLDASYEVIFTATDTAQNTATAIRNVTVVDSTPPSIFLNGGNVTLFQYTLFNDNGVTTSDNSELPVTISIDGIVNSNIVGEYRLTYTASDTKGNAAQVTRLVTVTEEPISIPEVSGTISDASGTPLSDVSILAYLNGVLLSDLTVISGSTGGYSIFLDNSSDYTLVVQKQGYSTKVIPLSGLSDSGTTLNILMFETKNVISSINPEIGIIGSDGEGSIVVIEANDLISDNSLELTMTSLNTAIGSERELIPGNVTDPNTLFFIGLTEFTFTDEATQQEVNLAAGQTAEITIPIYRNKKLDGTPYSIGNAIQLYYLNETTGIWVNEGQAKVVASVDSPTGFAATATVSHFSWWALSYPTNPALLGNYPSVDSTNDVVLTSNGSLAFISGFSTGTKSLNVSNPINITLLDTFGIEATGLVLSSDETKLYVNTATFGVQVLDINDPNNMSLIANIPVGTDADSRSLEFTVSADDSKLFIDSINGGFDVWDITNPSSPILLSSIAGLAYDIKDIELSADEKTAFLAYREAGLAIVDLTDLSNISLSSTIDVNFAIGLSISNDPSFVYVTGLYNKLNIVNVSNKSNPVIVGSVDLTNQGRGVIVNSTETHAYVAAWESGVQVIDITDKSNPLLVGNVNTEGKSINLVISDDDEAIYVADMAGGLQIVDAQNALLGNSIPPTITLNGSSYINHLLGTPYMELGATAEDDLDGPVSVSITGTVNISLLNQFNTITYTATDSSGNTSTTDRTVYIVENPNDDGHFIDSATGLVWQDNSAVVTNIFNWFEAVDYCANLSLAGYTEWRLPNGNEIQSAILESNTPINHHSLNRYWLLSSGSSGDYASFWDFNVGDGASWLKTNTLAVRCVN